MTTLIMAEGLAVPIHPKLVEILASHLPKALAGVKTLNEKDSVMLHFRNPNYPMDRLAYRPIKINLTYQEFHWHFDYITELSYARHGRFLELTPNVDFDFSLERCQRRHLMPESLADAEELYQLFETTFIKSYEFEAYDVKATFTSFSEMELQKRLQKR